MENHKRIVEINGVNIEVDLRTAKRVDNYRVGDCVKVLVKEYSDYKSHVGVIVGFDEFNKLPTLTVAFLKVSYSEVEMKFISVNTETKDTEIAPLQDHDRKFDFNKAVEQFDNKILKAKHEVEEIEHKKTWFLNNYEKYFHEIMNLAD